MRWRKQKLEASVLAQYGSGLSKEELHDLVSGKCYLILFLLDMLSPLNHLFLAMRTWTDPILHMLESRGLAKEEGTCTIQDFVLKILLKLDRVTAQELEQIADQFKEVDRSGDGKLTVTDVSEMESIEL